MSPVASSLWVCHGGCRCRVPSTMYDSISRDSGPAAFVSCRSSGHLLRLYCKSCGFPLFKGMMPSADGLLFGLFGVAFSRLPSPSLCFAKWIWPFLFRPRSRASCVPSILESRFPSVKLSIWGLLLSNACARVPGKQSVIGYGNVNQTWTARLAIVSGGRHVVHHGKNIRDTCSYVQLTTMEKRGPLIV